MKPVNPLACLIHIACQAQTSEKKFAYAKKIKGGYIYVNKNQASMRDLENLISHFNKSATLLPYEEKQIVDQALACLYARTLEKQKANSLWAKMLGRSVKNNRLENLQDSIRQTRLRLLVVPTPITSEAQARCKFSLEFKKIFHTTPKALAEKESLLLDMFSKRIWHSSNVQEENDNQKYAKYKKLMTEFYVGSHMLFQQGNHEDLIQDINQAMHTEKRVSSHYGKIGSEKHHHIRGKQLPEILFHQGLFATRNVKNKLHVVPGKYLTNPLEQQDQSIKALWIQTERTPDGPKWIDWLKHRTVDFGQYFFLKKIVKSPRPQIAKYTGPKGHGKPDSDPIFIRL